MVEDRDAVRTHVSGVRGQLIPTVRMARFADAERLISRFESIVDDWEKSRTPDASAIIEVVNEICVAVQLLGIPNASSHSLVYEPQVTPSGKSIDFLLTSGQDRHYFDVKTIRPRDPEDALRAWCKYGELRQLFPAKADLMLAQQFMGGEFWHYISSARSKFLENTLALERKIAEMSGAEGKAIRHLVFCGDGFRWHLDDLEDFADFYRTGSFRPDDPLWPLQAHYMKEKKIVLQRSIHGFCYLERPPISLEPDRFVLDVRGPPLF